MKNLTNISCAVLIAIGLMGTSVMADPVKAKSGGFLSSSSEVTSDKSANLLIDTNSELEKAKNEIAVIAEYSAKAVKIQKRYDVQMKSYKTYIDTYIDAKGGCKIMKDQYSLMGASTQKVKDMMSDELNSCIKRASFKLKSYVIAQSMIKTLYKDMKELKEIAQLKGISAIQLDKTITVLEAQIKYLQGA